ncbi:hypothetical protein PMAYCL1PPCAC_11630, partial [Pristionchus mayeri]
MPSQLVQISHTIVWGARFSQMITILMIATNRLTAVRFPMKHEAMWSKPKQIICVIIQITSIIVFGYMFVSIAHPIPVPSTFGGVFTVNKIGNSLQKVLSMFSVLIQLANGLLVLIIYVVILRTLRIAVKKVISQANFSRESKSIHKVSAIVCLVELEASILIYIVKTAIYTSIPPYLLIMFSKNIRERI